MYMSKVPLISYNLGNLASAPHYTWSHTGVIARYWYVYRVSRDAFRSFSKLYPLYALRKHMCIITRIAAMRIIFTRIGCTLLTCDMYMSDLRHISLKMEGVRFFFFFVGAEPGLCSPDALRPVGLLCTAWFSTPQSSPVALHVQRRERPLLAREGSMGEEMVDSI
jgi:hypothetical protein